MRIPSISLKQDLYSFLCFVVILLVQSSGNAQQIEDLRSKLQLGLVWGNLSSFYGAPTQEMKWGEKGRLLFFNRNETELQVYLDENSKVESFILLYYDGMLLGERKDLLDKLAMTDGVFVKVVDEKDKKLIKFKGMAYINTDKKTSVTLFFLTGPKGGYQHLYVEATYRESDLRRFNRQIFEQIRKKVRWKNE